MSLVTAAVWTVAWEEYKAISQPLEVFASEEPTEPREVRLEVVYDWTEERIIKEIRETFPETPNTAVAVAKCESGLKVEIQSGHVLSYGQEQSFGLFQIHKPDWHQTAINLGFEDYATNPKHNIALARHIYQVRGWGAWTCYTKGLHTRHL